MDIQVSGGSDGGNSSFGNHAVARGGGGSKGGQPMDEHKKVWSGICTGGPMDSREGASRFPSGFLLVDRPNNRVWIYDWDEVEGRFYVRISEGQELINDPDAPKNRFRAAEESEFDIRALDEDES